MQSSTLILPSVAAACALLFALALLGARSAVRAGRRAAASRATLLAAAVVVPVPAIALLALFARMFGRGPVVQLMAMTTIPLAVGAIPPIARALRRSIARAEGARLTPTLYAAVDVGIPAQYWLAELVAVFAVVALVGVAAAWAFGPGLVLACGLPVAVAMPTVLRASLAPRFAGRRLAQRVAELQAGAGKSAGGAVEDEGEDGTRGLVDARAWTASLAEAHGLPAPAVVVAPMSATYVASSSPSNAVIVIDDRLFHAFAPSELQAVLAHEVAHLVRHERMRRAVAESFVAAWYVGVFLLVSHLRGPVGSPYLIAWLLSFAFVRQAVQRWSTRQGEFNADLTAARWLGDPAPMISALRTIARVRGVSLEHHTGLRPSFGERIAALGELDAPGRGRAT